MLFRRAKNKKNFGIRKILVSPLIPCLVCWFCMFVYCSISYWQPSFNLDCTAVQMLQEQSTWSKIPTCETNRYIFYEILTFNCIFSRCFHMSPTFWRVGALGPQNLNSWLEHYIQVHTLSKQKRFNRPQKLILGGLIQNICFFFNLLWAYTVPTVMAAGNAGGTIIVMMSRTRRTMRWISA